MKLELNKIYNIDCLEGMKQLDDNSIDCIVTDPPYNLRSEKWDDLSPPRMIKFTKKWVDECYRILKEGGSLYSFFSQFHIPIFQSIITEKFVLRNIIAWYYPNNCGGYAGFLKGKHCYVKRWQPIFFVSKGNLSISVRTNWSRYSTNNFDVITEVVPQSNFKEDQKKHPTQKPIKLIKRLILASSNENDIILDPFLGSGTTVVVAKKLNRSYIGFETDDTYFNIAEQRLSKVRPNKSLFNIGE